MTLFLKHLRNKLLTGLLAAVPVIVVVYGAYLIETYTAPLTTPLGYHFPGLGFLIALVVLYVLGLLVTSILGHLGLRLLDRVLERIPGFKLLYHAWKDIVLLPADKSSIFHNVVLVPRADGKTAQIGFASGEGLPADPRTCCVFLPNIPNPLTGRLVFVDRTCCIPLGISAGEAFKFLLSTGNYLPADLQGLGARPDQGSEQPTPVQ
jgi:uncharacterized membrane protein